METGLMLSKSDLQRAANRERVALGTLEKDYVITEMLKALPLMPDIKEMFIFKGGTALRKVYFPDWRYSEDLDFTVKHDMAREELRGVLESWYRQVEQESQIRLSTRMLHKPGGYARVRTQFLGPLAYPSMIYMDLSFDEPLCLEPQFRRVFAYPFGGEEREVLTYPLEELLAEKLRSLLERGKSRDYYDVWRLLKEHSSELNLELLGMVMAKKLAHKGLRLHAIGDFLPEDLKELKRYWEEDLAQQISSLPPIEPVLEDLRQMLDNFVAPYILSSQIKGHGG